MGHKVRGGKIEHDQARADRFAEAMRKQCDPLTDDEFARELAAGGPKVLHTFVAHDSWCRTTQTGRGGDCNCQLRQAMAPWRDAMISNRHPADELADVRSEIRRLQTREAELRVELLAGQCGLVGDDNVVTITERDQCRLDLIAVRKRYGPGARSVHDPATLQVCPSKAKGSFAVMYAIATGGGGAYLLGWCRVREEYRVLARPRCNMLGKTEIALSAAIILSVFFPTAAATKHHRATHARAIHNMVPRTGGCTASGGPECSGACTGPGPCAPPDVP
jgi:hypothetical protein